MNRLITTVLLSLVTINTMVQAQTSRPRLVVGIVVDQLRTDYIDYLRHMFGEKGFKRLMDNGVFMRDVDFHRSVTDAPSATAVLCTGNWPSTTGLPNATIYDPASKRSVAALSDQKMVGNYSDEAYSPAALRISTIADEIAIDGAGVSAIYSVSTDPQQAIVLSGHAGKGAVWIDDSNGRWASTTYYSDFPQPLAIRNQYSPLSKRLDTIRWTPSRPLKDYPGVPPQKKIYPFKHIFPTSDKNVYKYFKRSAPANTEVADAAIECMKSYGMGKRGEAIDMIGIGLSAAPYKGVRDGDYRIELEDTYLRLDAEIGKILDEVDRTVGLNNALVWVASTGYYDDATTDDPRYRIPTGEFSLRRAESLLNAYLSAKYGNADYVESLHNGQVYLDRSLIERKNLNLDDIRNESRTFLLKMSGVAHAYTLDDILSGRIPGTEALRLSVDAKTCGDIFLSFNPGWNITDDINYPTTTWPVRTGQVLTPAFIMAPDVKVEEIGTPVDATAIAPTITSALHIRSPNGAEHRPMPLK